MKGLESGISKRKCIASWTSFKICNLKLTCYKKKSNALARGKDFLFCLVGKTDTGVVREDFRRAPGKDDLCSKVILCLRCPGDELLLDDTRGDGLRIP